MAERQTPLKAKALLQWWADRGIPAHCPQCNQNAWSALGTEDAGEETLQRMILIGIQDDGHDTIDPNVGNEVVGLACLNCGFMRLHALDYVRKAFEH